MLLIFLVILLLLASGVVGVTLHGLLWLAIVLALVGLTVGGYGWRGRIRR